MFQKIPSCFRTYKKEGKEDFKERREWTKFLGTDARLYKYPFEEQMLIYAQRLGGAPAPEIDYNALKHKSEGQASKANGFSAGKDFYKETEGTAYGKMLGNAYGF